MKFTGGSARFETVRLVEALFFHVGSHDKEAIIIFLRRSPFAFYMSTALVHSWHRSLEQ